MSGKARRGRVKRREVEGGDGWTVVTHGVVGRDGGGKTDKSENNSGLKGKDLLPSRTVEGLTAEKLLSEFRKLQDRWKDAAVAKQIEELVVKNDWRVRNAVCIGIGSFSRDWEHRHRSMWQLVLFVDLIHQIDKSKEVQMYAQEPAFTSLDVKFLQLLGVATVESGIEEHIDLESFVYSPFVDWYLLLPTFLAGKDPVLYVGNEILDDYSAYAQTEEKREKRDECDRLGSIFLKGRERTKLRDFEAHAHALNGMILAWRISDEAPT